MPEPLNRPLIALGGGTMASAVVLGGLDAGALEPRRVVVVDREPAHLARFEERGCGVQTDAAGAMVTLHPEGVVLLAVKPQSLQDLAGQIAGLVGDRLVVSMLAGVTSGRVREALGGACRVVRAMPNTPARIRKGMTGIVGGDGVSSEDLALTEALFNAVGLVHRLGDESQMALFTLLAASGPAYVFYLAEALERAAVAQHMNPAEARRITASVIEGAAAMLREQSDADPAQLRAAVTSKGGVTAAAVGELEARGVMQAFEQALRAGVLRDAELNAMTSR